MGTNRVSKMAMAGALAFLSGCADHVVKVADDVDATGMPNAELQLQRSMERADAAMSRMGAMSGGRAGAAPIPAELSRPETFAWSGPIDVGAKALADRIGYRLSVTSDPLPPGAKTGKPLPVIVSVNQTGRVLDLFEALGTSAGAQATVIVDPDHHQVDIQHHV